MGFLAFLVALCVVLKCNLFVSGSDPMTRAKDLVKQMTLQEKFSMLAGVPGTYVGNTKAIDRLGIPAMKLQDGPQGFRGTDRAGGPGSSTAWPSLLTIGASWDADLVYRWAQAMGEEFKAKGANMHLGPGIGIARVPTAGRNFEYLCGEDPILGATLVPGIIRGIQEQGIIANAKHYVNNEIEEHRMLVSSNVDERTRFELYYPPFQAAVDAGVLSVMCAYNQVNDVYACQNNDTLGHLRNDMGFQGYIVSDWTATKSTEVSLKATMNQEMPYGLFYSDYMLQKKLDSGAITEQDIDDSVTSILYALYAAGIMDTPPSGNPTANVTSDAHNQLAREIAAKSTVLVKNSANLLPLNENNLKSCIAVFGDETTVAGGGSGHVEGPYVITPTQGIQNALTNANIQVLYNKGSDLAAAGALAAQCDVAVVVVATSSTEGLDRDSLDLPAAQNDLVTTVQQNNKNTIVAVNTPGAVLLPWAKDVSTILIDFFPGQEFGNALADVLFGKVNPSARLPVTIPNKENEVGFSKRQYPGVGFPPEAYYTEELLIGYRWYDANEVEPVFPFGHGLSYSTFQYSDLRQKTATVPMKSSLLSSMKSFSNVNEYQVTITNTGSLEGDEVVQLYVEYPKLAREPPKQLRKFAKIHLKPAESKTVSFSLTERDVAIWNVESHAWEVVSGQYNVHVGASSRDIRQVAHFLVNSSA